MAKRHTSQTHKQELGIYLTKHVNEILFGFEDFVKDQDVIDPFVGEGDLLRWALDNGAKSVIGHDIRDDIVSQEFVRDSILNPPSYSNKLVVTNPPYLSANKSKGKFKQHYTKWNQTDLYKCFLASLNSCNADKAIVIIPSNFLCESSSRARETLFNNYSIRYAVCLNESSFADTLIRVVILYLERKPDSLLNFGFENIPCKLVPQNITIQLELHKEYSYLYGGHELSKLNTLYKFERINTTTSEVNSNIVVGCLDKGRYKLGFHLRPINEEPLRPPKTIITTFQLNTIGFTLSIDEQTRVVQIANETLNHLRTKYHGFFLSNYMGGDQKILSQSLAKLFLSDACYKLFNS